MNLPKIPSGRSLLISSLFTSALLFISSFFSFALFVISSLSQKCFIAEKMVRRLPLNEYSVRWLLNGCPRRSEIVGVMHLLITDDFIESDSHVGQLHAMVCTEL